MNRSEGWPPSEKELRSATVYANTIFEFRHSVRLLDDKNCNIIWMQIQGAWQKRKIYESSSKVDLL